MQENATADPLHQRRVRRVLLVGSAIMAAYSLFWGGYFGLQGHGLMAIMSAATLGLAGATCWLVKQDRLRRASWMLMAVLFGLLCFSAAVMDVPTAEVPRTAHQFLLALAVVSGLLMRDEKPWLRHGGPALCFLAYLGFAGGGSDFAVASELALPSEVRRHGGWVNLVASLLILYLTIKVIQDDNVERNSMEGELLDAMVHGDLALHYQPQVNSQGHVVGAEALVRWRHPQRGKISPAMFVPLAERSGLMPALGEWVRQTACMQLAAWATDIRTSSLVLSVNVSMLELTQPDFVERVFNCVERYGIHPSRLKLEITESALAHDINDIIGKMEALKARGIRLSLDDFGTGFSSLSYLRRLPLDQLKIDKSFVRNVLSSPQDEIIVQTVVDLGCNLGLEVIAEGVETLQQQQFLAGLGCDVYQGNLFSRPLTASGFDAFLKRVEATTQRTAGRSPWFEETVN